MMNDEFRTAGCRDAVLDRRKVRCERERERENIFQLHKIKRSCARARVARPTNNKILYYKQFEFNGREAELRVPSIGQYGKRNHTNGKAYGL